MKRVIIREKEYELIKDYRDAYLEEEVKNRVTDYFDDYDYICGDWAYGKLRLKGFYDSKNKKATNINNYQFIDKYIETNCAKNARHFIVKKI